MLFDSLLVDLPGEPAFQPFVFRETNPRSAKQRRRVYAPNDAMRLVHQRLIEWLRGFEISMPFAYGSVPGRNPWGNVNRHRDHRYFYVTDLDDAYGHLTGPLMTSVLVEISPGLRRHQEEVIGFLRQYCFTDDGLIVGAPASPDLFNLYGAIRLDQPLEEIAKRHRLRYSRYLDDLTFSADNPIGSKKRREIRQILEQAEMRVNHAKSRVVDLREGPVVITGIGLDRNGRMFLPRRSVYRLRSLIWLARHGHPIEPARIHGFMAAFWAVRNAGHRTTIDKRLIASYRAWKRSLLYAQYRVLSEDELSLFQTETP